MDLLTFLMRVATHMSRRARSAVLVILWTVAVPGITHAAEGDSLEYAVKAAYLYKFGIYVDWPAAAFESPSAPLIVCIVGDDPFGPSLDAAVSGQKVDTHPVEARRLKTVGRDSGCHILYLGMTDSTRASQIIETLRGSHVLTVSDAKGANVGIITFVVKDNRVRFNIDDEAAAQNGLGISSKLLSLALNVKPRQSKGAR